MYAVTTDGFRYRIDQRGMDPDGWVEYGSQLGFLDPNGTTPLYHDAVADSLGSPGQLTNVDGGVIFAPPSFPIFFTPPSNAALTALGIPLVPIASVVSNIDFAGTVVGSTSFQGSGGTFTYTSNVAGVYQIVISLDGVDFDPTNPNNRVLSGLKAAGTQTVAWDGKDNAGNFFPAGGPYPFKIDVHAGEYHFPFIDDENDTQGGPTITMLNPPGGVCPPFTGGCSGGFYDDRGYTTTTGVTVGTPGTVLCGLNPPAIPFSNPITGFNTSGTQRAFGADPGLNTNAPCTGSFGDAKGLDLWTYYPSEQLTSTLNIVPPGTYADIAVNKTVSNTKQIIGDDVTYTIAVHNNGPDDATGVAITDVLPNGLVYVSSAATVGTYDAAGGLWTIGALADGATATLHITVRTEALGAIVNTATKSAETQTDPNPSNDTSSARVLVSPVPPPPVPNTGAAPASLTTIFGGALAMLGALLCVMAFVLRRQALTMSPRIAVAALRATLHWSRRQDAGSPLLPARASPPGRSRHRSRSTRRC